MATGEDSVTETPQADRSLERDRFTVTVPMPLSGSAIALLGRFNPAIFQPAWMATHNLIRNEEAVSPKNYLVFPDFSMFATTWFRIQVTNDKFELICLEKGYEGPVKDLVLGIFALLEHTPFEQMGLNYFTHFKLESVDVWQHIEQVLLARSPLPAMLGDSGLSILQISGRPKAAPGAVIQLKVEPSRRQNPGLFVGVTEHYEVKGTSAARQLMDILTKRWDDALAYAKELAEQVYSLRHEARG